MKGFEETGMQAQIEGAGGKAYGVIWIPVSTVHDSEFLARGV